MFDGGFGAERAWTLFLYRSRVYRAIVSYDYLILGDVRGCPLHVHLHAHNTLDSQRGLDEICHHMHMLVPRHFATHYSCIEGRFQIHLPVNFSVAAVESVKQRHAPIYIRWYQTTYRKGKFRRRIKQAALFSPISFHYF